MMFIDVMSKCGGLGVVMIFVEVFDGIYCYLLCYFVVEDGICSEFVCSDIIEKLVELVCLLVESNDSQLLGVVIVYDFVFCF